jgi:hypothetical protein
MNISNHLNNTCRVVLFLGILIIATISATPVFGLPIGYPEDFTGCSAEPDQGKRDMCCDSVATDCNEVCGQEKMPGALIICGWDCDDANRSCKDGNAVKARVDWPERPGLQIPGIFTDRNRILTDEGTGLGISTRSVVIEIHSDNRHPERSTCAAVVASCNCPVNGSEYGPVTRECRPVVSAGVVECQNCIVGESSQACESCEDCVPVVSSVNACADAKPGGDQVPVSSKLP